MIVRQKIWIHACVRRIGTDMSRYILLDFSNATFIPTSGLPACVADNFSCVSQSESFVKWQNLNVNVP